MTTNWLLEAARNNAEWCDVMCRAHGLTGAFGPRVWSSPVRTPMYYPDAVTLDPAATAGEALAGIDAGDWASIKDSFAAFDELPGFEVLFEAEWIHRDPPTESAVDGDLVWGPVRDPDELRAWELAWSGGHDQELFKAALLDDVSVVRGRTAEGEIVCGAVLNASGEVVGVSNVFASGRELDEAWAGVLAMAVRLFPRRPLVGYETETATALRHGFTAIGPLRVWLNEGAG
ncbi:hypothetical protein OIE66_37550 [Nonomuraea sp. NBC_01738]|uniref:hypothetical protein n=1 Tax=Nonomuraea sp. NBC_01738 TaxID=2976003 RepID=UPI002E149B1A|nr:hypothetical protein OIE66_37550 [Nonomuraea sp. NBC_01738]